MNPLIQEKRKLTLQSKRINSQTIREIAALVEKQYLNSLNSGVPRDHIYIWYSVDANDNSSFDSQSPVIFEDEIISKKVLDKVAMRFNLINNTQNIELQLAKSIDSNISQNFVVVSGSDDAWVKKIFFEIQEIWSRCEPQPKITNISGWLIFIGTVIFDFFVYRLAMKPQFKEVEDYSVIFCFVIWFASWAIATRIHSYLESAYPI